MGDSNDTLFNSLIHWVKNLCGFKIVSEFMDHPVHGKSWFDASIWIEIHGYACKSYQNNRYLFKE